MTAAPRPVRDLAERLRVACKTDPVMEWDYVHGHWRITVSNKRVVMTLDFKMTSGGRWVWASSTLTIDGVREPLTSGFDHFVRVWKNPEELINRDPVPPPISTPIEVVSLENMPADVVFEVKQVVGKNGLTMPIVGFVDEHFWAVEFTFPRAALRIHWSRKGNDPMPTDHVYLMIDGEDKSDLAQGKMTKALAVIGKIPHPGAAGPVSIDGATGAQRDRGVEVRSTHVIRT